jgi:serine/threonine protein kinase
MSAMRAHLESLNVGDTFLTKYEIRGLIGRGGQVTVFHSYDTFIDRDVAIKIMADAFDSKRDRWRHSNPNQLIRS